MAHFCTRFPTRFATALVLSLVALPAPSPAQVAPEGDSALDPLAFSHPDLHVFLDYRPARDLPALEEGLLAELAALGVSPEAGFYDTRGGRWGTLLLRRPLIPGSGVGNTLTWSGGPPADDQALGQAAWSAFLGFLGQHRAQLRVDPAEIGAPTLTVHEGGRLVQMNARRTAGGVEVRDSLVMGVVRDGNLILYGTRSWGSGALDPTPSVSRDAASGIVAAHTAAAGRGQLSGEPRLAFVTLQAGGPDPLAAPVGYGYDPRLVWVMDYRFAGDQGTWEALVDAHGGTLLSFADRNQYADREVRGGVLPVSNDGKPPDGVEQAGFAMPFADLFQPFGTSMSTNSSGLAPGAGNLLQTTLSGPFVRMSDGCGPVLETATCADLDLGGGPGTDCDVPAGASAGNTHASRTGFYEVNRIKEQARGWLPENAWLEDQITANMNIANACNAFWDGSTINFYRQSDLSGTGTLCRNTGEIAAVFDHEWGHGMDDNDALPDISRPGEAPADIYAMVRLDSSCIGRGFFIRNNRRTDRAGLCDGFGDLCLECSGVREADWTKRASGLPHDLNWILKPVNSPGVPGVVPPGGCVGADTRVPAAAIQAGPCGQGTHCEGNVVSEALWDLIARDLSGFEGSPFALDRSTALNLVARLHYLGGGNVGLWYLCNAAAGTGGGCNADGGYLNYLAADDDNGSLLDGTPHMTAIHAAFARHGLACPAPLPTNAGCSGGPTAAPAVTATAEAQGARLAWTAVPGAQRYWVYRADGVFGCDFGKERLAETTGPEFADTGLVEGRSYFYAVEAVGASDACRSPASACATVVPTAPAAGGAPALAFRGNETVSVSGGDGDAFLDNCETLRVGFQVENAGPVDLHDVRIVAVETSNPGVTVATPLPAVLTGTLAAGSCPGPAAAGTVDLVAGGLAPGETLEVRVHVTADELAAPLVGTTRIGDAESDLAFTPRRTFSFETDFEGWRLASGTYTRESPGANTTSTHLASSSFQAGQCDRIQSPLVRVRPESSLSLFNQFSTEPGTDETGFYDRANVGLFDVESGQRTPVSPDGGRAYNAGGANGACVTEGQPGWAGAGPGFLESTWSAAALGATAMAGRLLRLDVAYGTDPLVEGAGFQFDEVTLLNADVQGPDGRSDACQPAPPCGAIDDADAAVEYSGGWHRFEDSRASGGGYHRRLGKNKKEAVARVAFSGDRITYFFVKSGDGGTADVFVDGVLKETLGYASGGDKKDLTFGHSRTYVGLGSGPHEIVVVHRGGAVFVDGFDFACGGEPGADPAAAGSGSVTVQHAASGTEGPVIDRGITVGASDLDLSVVVEGAPVPLTVDILDGAGNVLASGGALVSGLAASGLDTSLPPGAYTVRVLNTAAFTGPLRISVARTVSR